jgi:hypothetical protein
MKIREISLCSNLVFSSLLTNGGFRERKVSNARCGVAEYRNARCRTALNLKVDVS